MLNTLYNLLREYISHPSSYKSIDKSYVGPVLESEAYDRMNEHLERFDEYFSEKCYACGEGESPVITTEMVDGVWAEIEAKLNFKDKPLG